MTNKVTLFCFVFYSILFYSMVLLMHRNASGRKYSYEYEIRHVRNKRCKSVFMCLYANVRACVCVCACISFCMYLTIFAVQKVSLTLYGLQAIFHSKHLISKFGSLFEVHFFGSLEHFFSFVLNGFFQFLRLHCLPICVFPTFAYGFL